MSFSSARDLIQETSNLLSLLPGLLELDLPSCLRTPKEVEVRRELYQNVLHAACRHQLSLVDVSYIMAKVPNAVKEADSDGSLPLHIACYNDSPMDVLFTLFNAFPEAISSKNKSGATPLHYFCARHNFVGDPRQEEECIFLQNMQAARVKDSNGFLPLHVACSNNVPIEVIRLLLKMYPEAVAVQDNFGDTPLHFICRGYTYAHDAARLLVETDRSVIDTKDSGGLRPIDILIENALRAMNQYLEGQSGSGAEDWPNFEQLVILLTEASQHHNKPLPCPGNGLILHALLTVDSCPSKCIRWALKMHPEQAKEHDGEGNFPLHKLASLHASNHDLHQRKIFQEESEWENITKEMIHLNKNALCTRNNEGLFPLALATHCSESCIPRLIFFACPFAISQIWDTPLYADILAYIGHGKEMKEDIEEQVNSLSKMYQLVRETMDLIPPIEEQFGSLEYYRSMCDRNATSNLIYDLKMSDD